MIRKFTVNNNWKPFSRHHQFKKAFKNGMYGFRGGSPKGWRIAKVRFVRHARNYPFVYGDKYDFGNIRKTGVYNMKLQLGLPIGGYND